MRNHFTCWNTSGTDFLSTSVFSPKYGPYGRPRGYGSSYRVPPSEHGIDNIPRAMPRKPRFPIWGVPPKPALTAARELRSLMHGVPPSHSILEEDSRYSRNALGARMATYWFPNT
jgi:hypothetical protein